ncbi:MAG: cardiolipin synthase [Spirochaetales bacterium]|nr:cardiolipin synthase [Spirochaetales bacterium]
MSSNLIGGNMFSLVQIIYTANLIITIITTLAIILSNRDSSTSLLWIALIYAVPVFGLLIFILLGIDWQKHKLLKYSPESALNYYRHAYDEANTNFLKELEQKDPDVANDIKKLIRLIERGSHSSLTYAETYRLFYRGEDFFSTLFDDLRSARKQIHMDFFIWKSDILGREIKDILIQKAAEGVEIRLIFDGYGSFKRISRQYRKELRKAGIDYRYFLDLRDPMSRHKINYNNHKKIITIDGTIGYLGGMNVGQEYIDGGRRFDCWRDTQMRLTGGCIALLDSVFLADWANCTKGEILYPDPPPQVKERGPYPLQIAVSGPDSDWFSVKLAYLSLIANANNEVLIQSPYFVPDSSMVDALVTAALSGTDVRFMITGVPDKLVAWWAAHTYLEKIVKAGARVYFYEKGFLHSKVFIVDDHLSSVGTCNMDIRSFHLHYEINAMLYSDKITTDLRDQFFRDVEECRELTLKDFESLGFFKRFRNSLSRLASPFM